ncbi:SMI1/KNR4 family protein [Paenibacillus sp. SC116]|uniref:SMI1/KNR4 family protein n=1 Tax=Paenibacillus sp. SC116 TaxID=2968986 RepID=UPI00215B193A|nr:SMI1/KNR4 family protein [Paenibacillus sp. SC116]MCR8842353.1 SMI1/KNR4 family protein [Paenibacillus sp. SC116]
MIEAMKMWIQRWEVIISQIEQQGANVHPLAVQPGAAEEEIKEVEERIGIPLPSVFRELLKQGASEVGVYWSLPDEAMLPEELKEKPSGDFGWSLRGLDWPYFGGDEDDPDERCYLQFYTAGNGDALLIKIDDGKADPAVWYWGHEDGEFDLLAPSFTEYVERVTRLGCIGTDCGQHRPFLREDGLDLRCSNAQVWLKWLDRFLTLTLEQASANLEMLLEYASMHGADDPDIQDAFARFDRSEVCSHLISKLEQTLRADHQQAWGEIIVRVCASEAVNWVRSLWHGDETFAAQTRDYLTAHCLPEEEGLTLVIRDIESREEKGSIYPYTALHRLRHFRNRSVISWMKPYVAFPIDGWDLLLAESQPSAEDLLDWLSGSDAERQTAVHAICKMMKQQTVPTTLVHVQQWEQLLSYWRDKEILRNNKRVFDEAISGLCSWNAS